MSLLTDTSSSVAAKKRKWTHKQKIEGDQPTAYVHEHCGLYKFILQHVKQAVLVVDGDGRVVFSNESFALLLHSSSDNMEGASLLPSLDCTAQEFLECLDRVKGNDQVLMKTFRFHYYEQQNLCTVPLGLEFRSFENYTMISVTSAHSEQETFTVTREQYQKLEWFEAHDKWSEEKWMIQVLDDKGQSMKPLFLSKALKNCHLRNQGFLIDNDIWQFRRRDNQLQWRSKTFTLSENHPVAIVEDTFTEKGHTIPLSLKVALVGPTTAGSEYLIVFHDKCDDFQEQQSKYDMYQSFFESKSDVCMGIVQILPDNSDLRVIAMNPAAAHLLHYANIPHPEGKLCHAELGTEKNTVDFYIQMYRKAEREK